MARCPAELKAPARTIAGRRALAPQPDPCPHCGLPPRLVGGLRVEPVLDRPGRVRAALFDPGGDPVSPTGCSRSKSGPSGHLVRQRTDPPIDPDDLDRVDRIARPTHSPAGGCLC